jgi:hypothetical protein
MQLLVVWRAVPLILRHLTSCRWAERGVGVLRELMLRRLFSVVSLASCSRDARWGDGAVGRHLGRLGLAGGVVA